MAKEVKNLNYIIPLSFMKGELEWLYNHLVSQNADLKSLKSVNELLKCCLGLTERIMKEQPVVRKKRKPRTNNP